MYLGDPGRTSVGSFYEISSGGAQVRGRARRESSGSISPRAAGAVARRA